jgi:NAD-dependent SIR2 family protein deacetylase
MPIELTELAELILQRPVVLFLGAGASIPSGAPSGPSLAVYLQNHLVGGEDISNDLMELASILESRIGREPLVRAIQHKLEKLTPRGGLMALPEVKWDSIYTTNFDDLVEKAFGRCGYSLTPIRSNFEYGRETSVETNLFKIHGCISQDRCLGHKSSMILTEDDYVTFADFRKCLFKRLSLDFLTKSVLFIGYSLRDPHVRKEIKEALEQKNGGAPGQLFILF